MDIQEAKIGKFMIGVGCVMEHTPSGEILCLLRDRANFQKGEWELMYGRIDQHEELFEALRREVFEETGIKDFEIKKLQRIWHFYRGDKRADKEIHGFTFHCTTDSKEVALSTEHAEFRWVKPEEALKLIKVEGIREDVRFFLQQQTAKSPKIAFSGIDNKISVLI